MARPATRDPGAGGRRSRAHVPRALERSDPARPPQPAADRAAPPHRRAAPPRSAPAGPPGPAAGRHRRGPGAPHVSGEAPAVPLRARTASGASAARTARRWAAPGGSSTSRTSTCGRRTRPARSPTRSAARPSSTSSWWSRATPSRAERVAEASETIGRQRVLRDALRRRRRPGRGLRPRERGRHPDLRPRQGVRRRRHLARDRIRQPEPPLVDPRLGGVVRGARRRARRPRSGTIPPEAPSAPGGSPATRGSGCGASTSGARTTTTPTSSTRSRGSRRSAPPPTRSTRGTGRAGPVHDRPARSAPIDRHPCRVPSQWWARTVHRALRRPGRTASEHPQQQQHVVDRLRVATARRDNSVAPSVRAHLLGARCCPRSIPPCPPERATTSRFVSRRWRR